MSFITGDIITIKQEPENEVFQSLRCTGDVVEEPGPSTQHGKV